jgi:hypothetical protein
MTTHAPPATSIVPLISGRVRGPLGISHLPRLWLKLRLHAVGRLPEGYRHGEGGSDGDLADAFGFDMHELIAFIDASAPDHQAFEAWIRAHATTLSPEAIAAFNSKLETFEMPQPRRDEWSARFGLDGYVIAPRMNELDDWELAHAQIVTDAAPPGLVIPAISSSVTGPIGIVHLARLWFKKLLKLHGRLPADYRCGEGGFDGQLLDLLGIANDDMDAFVASAEPGYLAFEAWVRERTTATPAARAEFNAELLAFVMPDRIAVPRRAQYGLGDDVRIGILLNDIDDWGGLHEQMTALR